MELRCFFRCIDTRPPTSTSGRTSSRGAFGRICQRLYRLHQCDLRSPNLSQAECSPAPTRSVLPWLRDWEWVLRVLPPRWGCCRRLLLRLSSLFSCSLQDSSRFFLDLLRHSSNGL